GGRRCGRCHAVLRLEPRPRPSRAHAYLAPVVAVLLTLVVGAAIFTALGFDPLRVLAAYFVEPVSTLRGVGSLLVKATPLILIASGLALGFRANVWNIGAEEQMIIGGIVGGGIALALPETTSPLLLPGMLVAGMLGGMVWAAIPALLRTRFNA